MNPTATAFEASNRPLVAVLDALPFEAWDRPSACEDWSGRDVLRHMIDTQRDFLCAHVDLGPAPAAEADPVTAWHEHARQVLAAISSDQLAEKSFGGHYGPSTVGKTFAQFYVWDMVVHRWDLATAGGVDAGLTDEELDRIDSGADSFGEALYMEGICRPAVEPPADASRETRVLARLGRRG